MSTGKRKSNRFCQKTPPFLTYLKHILNKYPDGGQILKELIQNADDAGATEVIFVNDERDYGKQSLYSDDLLNFQGPALLAYNNATFSDGDWEGIQSTGNSFKLKDPDTVGRFGLGFNSVYHITDLPGVFSGSKIGMLDPQRIAFDDGGFMWSWEDQKDRKDMETLTDQFLPFWDALSTIDRGNWDTTKESGFFQGTLFRFPLRLRPTEISDNIYSSERVKELFDCFSKDASISLLFLRNVHQVSLKCIGHDGVVKHLLTASMTVHGTRTLGNINSASSKLLTSVHVKVTSLTGSGRSDEVCKWLVMASMIKEGSFQDLEDLAKKLNNSPTIGLAYSLSSEGSNSCGGRLSCFLPLPDREENRTGLPVLINASFDLTDDRRSIKWVEVDQQHDEAAQWNQLLVEKILPLVYCQAVQAAVSLVRSSEAPAALAYGIWPDPSQTQHKERWHWLTARISQDLLDVKVLCMAADSTKWLKASEAVFLPIVEDDNIQHTLEKLLLCVGEPLVKVPGHVRRALQLASSKFTGFQMKMATPSFIREVLRQGSWTSLPSRLKLLILEYVIGDGQYKDLLGLQLLPLSDGTFTCFLNTDRNGMAYIESPTFPRLLLPGLAGRFLPTDLKPDVLVHLRKIGENGTFSNLVCLDKEVITKNLLKALPGSWMNSWEQVTWHPGASHQPPREWLREFWSFLQRDVDLLSPFEGYPLVPLSPIDDNIQQVCLARLRKKSSLLFQDQHEHSLAENSAKMMESIGCTVIHRWDTQMRHKCLSQYIMAPSTNNIIRVFSNLGVDKVLGRLTQMPWEQKKLLSDVLSQASFFNAEELKILHQLPIFCKMSSLQSPGSEPVAAGHYRAIERCTIPAVPRDLLLPEVLLICRDEQDRRLLMQMGVHFLHAADVAALSAVAIRNGYYVHQQNKAEGIMLWVLRNGDVLFSQNKELKTLCKSLFFIPCNGNLVQPSALFDPQIKMFQDLFEHQRFPPKSYQEPLILKSLRTLGLKDSIMDITPGDILKIAQEVSSKQGVGELQVFERKARALVKICNDSQVLSTFEDPKMQTLCNLAWVPWISSNSKTTFLKPIELRSKKHSLLVEHSMPLTGEFNELASESLGLNEPPPAEKVIENLTALSKRYRVEDSYSLVMKLHHIYKHVQDNMGQFRSVLKCINIWNGDGFSDPTEILQSYPEDLDLSCQIERVPRDFLIYRSLFLQCGVRESISDEEVTNMLQKVMRDIQDRGSGCGTKAELKLAISILDWMKRRGLHSTDDLPVPVQSGRGLFTLKPLSTALFCDMPKERLNDLGDDLDYNIVHEDVPLTTATFLKLPLLSTKVLKPEYFEPWGPSEPITLRIKNILREYSEEVDLFKEIIQNSDDAGATICSFLVDMRQNLEFRNSLIDPAMASCHGPALWSYNNSMFSDEDFRNITRVGAATKELQVEKIGKFGLGFNTVYRVTDVPSILSGDSVLMFDPNANHLKKHIQSEANPGIKLNLQKHPHVLQVFSDQFHPYQKVFDCDLKASLDYNGTLIRLPFRTEEDAKTSKICDQSFNPQQITCLMDTFQGSSQNLIMFLKGVQEVTLGFLPSDSPSPEKQTMHLKVYREQVHKLNIPEDFLLQQNQKAVVVALAGNGVIDVNGSSIIKVTTIQSSTPHAKHYLLHSSFGIGDSFQTFQENNQKKNRFSLPLAGVALPLMKNTATGKWRPDLEGFDGQVFCFLPLPIFSGLPFHLNGSFSVMSNRKSLWDTTEKGEWNRKLLCDAVVVTWVRALAQLQQMCQDGDLEGYSYHTFWPDIRRTRSLFVEALKAFFRAVANGLTDEVLAVFSNGLQWCTIKHACFLSQDIMKNRHIGEMAAQVFSAMLPAPFVAVPLPEWVKAGFHASGCEDALLQNTYSWERFYREIVFSNLNSLDAEARDALMIHAIDMNNKEVDKLLKSVPCIPSTPSGTLQCIVNLVHPQGKVAPLFEKEDSCFPQGTQETYLNAERLSRLELLGMLKDSIPITRLMERARTIPNVWTHDRGKACSRINHVLELLKDLVEQPLSNTDQASFRKISFVPAVLPGHSNEQGVDIALKKPTEMYHYKHLNLVNMSEPVLSKEHVIQDFKFSSDIMAFLGLNRCPSFQTVILQLEEALRKSNILTQQELTQTVRKCYTFLNKAITANTANEIRSRARAFSFILIGRECVPLSSVARSVSFDAAPYLYELPKEYQVFDKLWDCVGLLEGFGPEDYIAVLQSMAEKQKGQSLSKKDFKLALTIINTGLQGTADDVVSRYEAQQIFLPDQDCVLRPADKLHFNDTPWLPCDKDTLFCHKMILRPVAMRFRVPTKIHRTLQNLKICDLSHWVSNFGAKEDLTRRIKNIISEYSSKKDILKELIQNADDSGATELHFVWDSRTHPAKRIFGEEWKPLQGPALCVYNNKVFTNEDIDGIQQLGKGGKGDKLDKTGKYGLGFNAVYHLTDCPAFVTGDNMLCVFDPNLLFLPTSGDDSPGGMFSVNQKFKGTFQDVYSTFLPALFNLEQGTLFRLPLRTAETVSKSQISNQTISNEDIKELWEELERDADNLMLFLNNMTTITFSMISNEEDQLKTILSVEAKLSSLCARSRQSFQEKLRQFAEVDEPLAEDLLHQVFYGMQVKCSGSKSSNKWILARKIGVHGDDKLADMQGVCKNLKRILLPHGALAACINDHLPGRAFCTLPLPVETGLPVHISGNFIVDSARRDICKEDGGSAKTEWNSLLLRHLLAPLYCDLLKHIWEMLTRSQDGPLKFAQLQGCENALAPRYLRFFPSISENIPPLWQKIVTQVYREIRDKQFPLIPVFKMETTKVHIFSSEHVVVAWSAVSQEAITEEPYFIIKEVQKEVQQVLHNINMKLVLPFDVLHRIFEEFKRAEVEVLDVCPQTVCNFLMQQKLHPGGHSLPLPVRETLLRNELGCRLLLNFCLKVSGKKKAACLNGVPLLVTQDGKLRKFHKADAKYHTRYYDLFPEQMHNFASCEAISGEHVEVLKTEGFLKEFTIQASAGYIKEQLGHGYQVSGRKTGDFLTLPENKKEWLKKVWEFFQSKIYTHNKETNCKHFQELISLFSDWAILPVSTNKDIKNLFLVPLGTLSNIIFGLSGDVDKYLSTLGFAVLNNTMIPMDIRFDCIKPLVLQTDDCSCVAQQLCVATNLQWNKLESWETDRFLHFFIDGIPSAKNKKDFLGNLQSLPLFKTTQNSRVCLNTYQKKFILETKVSEESKAFQELYQLDTRTVFLYNNGLNKELSQHLDIKIINDLELFITFVVPQLAQLHEEQLLKVLQMLVCIINHHWLLYGQYKDTIVPSLRPIKFIRDSKGKLQQASYFYDRTVPSFQTLGLHSSFIPEKFFKKLGISEYNIQHLLRDLGMKHEISEEDFIMFATQIERDARRGISVVELTPKIDILFHHLLSLKEDELQDSFINRVSCVQFLVPLDIKSELQSLHSPYAKHTHLIHLKNSLFSQQKKYVELVWTSASILSTERILSKNQLKVLEKCGVLCVPPTHLVLENLKNVCKAPCDTPELVTIRSSVLQKMYAFLQKDLSFQTGSLKDLPCVLVEDNAIVEPNQVVFSLMSDSEFRPYLYKLSPQLAVYSPLFQEIGVQPEPTLFHYARVLSAIYAETLEKESLHPNLKRTILKATIEFFKLLSEDKKTPALEDLKPLYLPATDGKLYESSYLVLNNYLTPMAMEKLDRTFKFLANLDDCSALNDLYRREKLINLFPEDMRPKLLSQITEVVIHEQSLEICKLGDDCEFKGCIQDLLCSSHFQEGLACLLRWQSKGDMLEEEAAKECSVVFGKLRIICCCKIQTILLYESEPLSGTNLPRQVFILKGGDGQCQVYLKHKDSFYGKQTIRIVSTLANEINGILQNMLSPECIRILMEMLGCKNPEDINYILKENAIWMKRIGSRSAFSLPHPGETIPGEWHDYLDMNVLNSFKVGDYVGYMAPSGEDVYLYVVIKEQLASKVSGQTEVQMYRIDLGPDRIVDASVLDLYQFKRRFVNKNNCRELVVVENLEEQKEKQDNWFEKSLGDIKKEIDDKLHEIWKLSKDERTKAIRRIYLKYHPDKNIGQEELATEICKYLQQKVKDLETGRNDNSQGYPKNTSNHSGGFSNFWSQWDGEASNHRQHREHFTRRSNCDYDFWTYHQRHKSRQHTTPRPEEAKRWFRQAECDLRAAANDIDHSSPEWVFYKIHQAIEKALIAAHYIKQGRYDEDCSITGLASKVSTFSSSLKGTIKVVSQLKRHGVDNKKTQYPSYHPTPGIPNDSFPLEQEEAVLQLAKDVLNTIEAYIKQ